MNGPSSCRVSAYGVITALCADPRQANVDLFDGTLPEFARREIQGTLKQVPVGRVSMSLSPLPLELEAFTCRNNLLANAIFSRIALQAKEAVARFGPTRVGVVLGSSTSGLDASEAAYPEMRRTGRLPSGYRFSHQHSMGSLSALVARLACAAGPAYTVSTACSSSAKAILCARSLLRRGICDAVISGGVDTLCELTIRGFDALGSLSEDRMNPMSANRTGLNIGEGGALFLLTRESGGIQISGGGETMDAYHMSAPHPDGRGARAAMEMALEDAGIEPSDVAYVNLHGTATRANDAMEANAVHAVFKDVPVSSTKPFTGHCLGAAGAIELAMCCMSLARDDQRLLPHLFDGCLDRTMPQLRLAAVKDEWAWSRRVCFVSNSFAFGGNNCSLVISREGDSHV